MTTVEKSLEFLFPRLSGPSAATRQSVMSQRQYCLDPLTEYVRNKVSVLFLFGSDCPQFTQRVLEPVLVQKTKDLDRPKLLNIVSRVEQSQKRSTCSRRGTENLFTKVTVKFKVKKERE